MLGRLLCTLALTLLISSTSDAASTRIVRFSPFTASGALRDGLKVGHQLHHGTCGAGSELGYLYRCGAEQYVSDPCWADTRAGEPRVACLYKPWQRRVTLIDLDDPPEPLDAPSKAKEVAGQPWAVRLASGRRCIATQGAVDRFGGKRIAYRCSGTLRLLGFLDQRHARWRSRTVWYHRHTGYTVGPRVRIASAYYAVRAR